MSTEVIHRYRKLPNILNGVATSNFSPGPAYVVTVLNNIMPTASLVIPSPNMTLKSFGCYSYLTTAMAATTSEEHIKEHIRRISIRSSSNGAPFLNHIIRIRLT
jgi:hypothetical protein